MLLYIKLTCRTLFLDDDTLNTPTVCKPNCSKCLMHIITTVGTQRLPKELKILGKKDIFICTKY